MAEQDGAHGFLDAAAIAFLARRLHNRRLRAAAARGVKGVSAEAGADTKKTLAPVFLSVLWPTA